MYSDPAYREYHWSSFPETRGCPNTATIVMRNLQQIRERGAHRPRAGFSRRAFRFSIAGPIGSQTPDMAGVWRQPGALCRLP